MNDDQSASQGDAGNNNTDWAGRYTGLQTVLNKRNDELTSAQQALAQAKAMSAAQEAELESYRVAARAAKEEADQQAQYEALRAKFEPEPPTPRGTNGAREPRSGNDDYPGLVPQSSGYPT